MTDNLTPEDRDLIDRVLPFGAATAIEQDGFASFAELVALLSAVREEERSKGWQPIEAGCLLRALKEAEWALDSAASIPHEDPQHQAEIEALGDRIGYGALMVGASAGWRKRTIVEGSEFVSGPCRITARKALDAVRAEIAKIVPAPPLVKEVGDEG